MGQGGTADPAQGQDVCVELAAFTATLRAQIQCIVALRDHTAQIEQNRILDKTQSFVFPHICVFL